MLVVVATIAQFILGAVWYSPLLFGKWWMQIMEVGHLSKEELGKMQKAMAPFYALQFFLALITTFVLAHFLSMGKIADPTYSSYMVAFWVWFGFLAPMSISSVIWANTKKRYWMKQIGIMLGMQLIGIMLATWILSM
jgi:hypothetical protein